ncbi:MAG: HlyD family efflux transporter periplasmic adaptor subunit [Deltaproteobacteria bacterium]|nr:HlyD family efflux transporter periplasmic adaptor subunit [Deltaproteobacteria bacterium]
MSRLLPIALLALSSACTIRKANDIDKVEEENLAEVAITKLEKSELYETLVFGGTLSPITKQALYPSLPGIVKDLFVKEGAKVKKGDRLVSISPDGMGLKYQDHMVVAPFAGTVIDSPVKIGERVEKSTEVMTVADLSSFKTTVYAALDDLTHLKIGQNVDVIVAPGRENEAVMQGTVDHIAVAPDKKSKAFPVTVLIKCSRLPCSPLHPGTVVTVSSFKDKHWGFKLPVKYLRNNNKQIIILKEDNNVSWIDVRRGKFYGDDVEIFDLDPTTRIVSSFSRQLKEGEKVKIVSE